MTRTVPKNLKVAAVPGNPGTYIAKINGIQIGQVTKFTHADKSTSFQFVPTHEEMPDKFGARTMADIKQQLTARIHRDLYMKINDEGNRV